MTLLIIIIALALIFDYINGFHDAANSIATIVSTKVLTPFQAVLWAAMFNFLAFYIFSDHAVANTIGKIVQKEFITLPVILSGLISSIIWNLITWWYGIPSSSSHTLIGGFAGAAICHAFMTAGLKPLPEIIDADKVWLTVLFIFFAPIIGMLISMLFTFVTIHRNTYFKIAMLFLTAVGLWFLFAKFQKDKANEEIAKLFNIEKLEKKSMEDSKYVAAYEEAKNNLAIASPMLNELESKNWDVLIKKMAKEGSYTHFFEQKLDDKLALFLKKDQLKIKAQKDKKFETVYKQSQEKYKNLKPLLALYATQGKDSMIKAMTALGILDQKELAFIGDKLKMDVGKELKKVFDKADNYILRYVFMGLILLFILSFFYNEIMMQPNALRTANMYKRLQLVSSAAFSVGHGGSDAQKVMGIIAAALVANGDIIEIKSMPSWVPISCYIAIGLGTLSGGWRIVKTMGSKITKVTPLEGVCAETAGAATLFLTAQAGIPVSTTHTITGSIMGVGATKRLSAVRWGVTLNLLWAWIITIPISAVLAAIVYAICTLFI